MVNMERRESLLPQRSWTGSTQTVSGTCQCGKLRLQYGKRLRLLLWTVALCRGVDCGSGSGLPLQPCSVRFTWRHAFLQQASGDYKRIRMAHQSQQIPELRRS